MKLLRILFVSLLIAGGCILMAPKRGAASQSFTPSRAAQGNVQSPELPKPDRGGVPESKLYDYGVMGPPATPDIVAAADRAVTKSLPAGPFAPTWESILKNYKTPAWFLNAKFGIFMHWGLYAVPAHGSEWYEKHMYGSLRQWHAENFGPQETFGYK